MTPHGSPDPVTNPSISPDTASTPTRPRATVNNARPSSARARPRGRGPGSTIVQNSRSPAAPETNTAVSSSSPCGLISCRNMSSRPYAAIRPPAAPTFTALLSRKYTGTAPVMPVATQSAETHALLVHTIAANVTPGW